MLIEFMMRGQRLADFIMLQQHRAGTGILGEDKVGFLQDLNGPERNVFEISDRSRYYIQYAWHRRLFSDFPAHCRHEAAYVIGVLVPLGEYIGKIGLGFGCLEVCLCGFEVKLGIA